MTTLSTRETMSLELPQTLPVLPVRDVVVFPHMVLPLAIGREQSIRALEEAAATHKLVFLATQRRIHTETPQQEDLFAIGTVAEVLQLLKMPDGTLKILVQGLARAQIRQYRLVPEKGHHAVEVLMAEIAVERTPELEALMRQCLTLFDQYAKLSRRVPFEVVASASTLEDPGHLADTVASHLAVKMSEKQALLELTAPAARLEKLIGLLNAETEILTIERKIQHRVRNQIEKTQKEYYLTEQMKAIQKELRQKDEHAKELDELRQRVQAAKMSKEATEAAEKEVARLEKTMPFSPEATVIRTYLDWLLGLPWSLRTQDNLDLARAATILQEDHYGLEKAKERVVEYLAVLKLVQKIKGPILCFVGPPGVGKTSLAKSFARALERTFVRMSLGGVRDESEIRGHRRTYIGSLPGRLLQCLRKAKSKNPVFLLDEVDKMGTDWRGDPAAALLEVLDPEQNHAFVDHYLDVEFDLSEVLFICTANTLYAIPHSLQDRMEVLRFPGYTDHEKFQIARRHLIPKQQREHGLAPEQLRLSEGGLRKILQDYTREAGVRHLERQIATLCRKSAKLLVSQTPLQQVVVTQTTVPKLLGVPEFHRERAATNGVGTATGLAWTEHGGEVLTIEVALLQGKGKVTLTGKLGPVMQESAQAAMSYVRSQAARLTMKERDFQQRDFHIHVPEGAIPKDGPSAGIAIATALASALTRRPVKRDVAMTGEITLGGRVLPIGGLKEKLLAAHREGIQTVLFPHGNLKDLEDVPPVIQKKLRLIPIKGMEEVLTIALP